MTEQQVENFDIIVFGATSFVGKIICRYLAKEVHDGRAIKWSAAARNQSKLNELSEELCQLGFTAPPTLVANANDISSLLSLCHQTKTILSTVGPYSLYGEPMVKACVESGTDYVDLTGEPQFIKAMQDKYESNAQASGARIIHCCGFDSIPSDIGVFYLQQAALQKFNEPCQQVAMRVRRLKGGASGGTIASMMNIVEQASKDKALRRTLANPYVLCPKDHKFRAYQPNLKKATLDTETGTWIAPFVMAAINTRVVHRSNALLSNLYGERFIYDEAMMTGKGGSGMLRGWTMAAGLSLFMLGAVIGPIRKWMESSLLPKPGEGPSPEEQENGFYDMRFYGTTASGKKLVAKVTGDKDPGYGSTAKIISEAAICLTENDLLANKQGGFYTPAAFYQETIIKLLTDNAGLTFEIIDD